MKTKVCNFPYTARKSQHSTTIHTTLYDLIAALSAEVAPDEEDALTATVVHLLNAHRVTCTGNLHGCRLVCDVADLSAHAAPTHDELSSYVER